MPIATLQPPANPVVIQSTENSSAQWTCTQTNGTVLATNTTTPVNACATALNTASVTPSTLVTLLSPSGNPTYHGQLNDMPTSGGF
jgi:hypothetical protein